MERDHGGITTELWERGIENFPKWSNHSDFDHVGCYTSFTITKIYQTAYLKLVNFNVCK